MSEAAIQHCDPHERRDVSIRGLLIFAAVLAALLLVSAAALWFIFGVREGGFAAAQYLGQTLPGDELEQRDQLANYLKAQNAELDRLAWTDGTHQTAKVPIKDAMKLLAAKGDKR